MAALGQRRYAPLPDWKQVLLIFAVSEGYAAAVDPGDMEAFEEELYGWMEARQPRLVQRLRTGAKLSGEEQANLRSALRQFTQEAQHGDAE